MFGSIAHLLHHIVFQLLIIDVVSHRQTVRKVLSIIHLSFMMQINLLLNLVYLRLNVVETPLLTLLHLDHHLLDLFELLETVGLHLLELLLFLDQHLETFLVFAEEGVLGQLAVLGFCLDCHAGLSIFSKALVELVLWEDDLLLRLLSDVSHIPFGLISELNVTDLVL